MAETLYQLKVTLLGIKPPIWRRLVVDPGMTLKQLHRVLQAAMEWEDYHLYEFRVGRVQSAESGTGIPGIKAVARTRLADVLQSAGSKLTYVYDFGDEWGHEVRLERFASPAAHETIPICLEGARAGPPEDSAAPLGMPSGWKC